MGEYKAKNVGEPTDEGMVLNQQPPSGDEAVRKQDDRGAATTVDSDIAGGDPATPKRPTRVWTWRIVPAALLAAAVATMLMAESPQLVGVAALGAMLTLMALKVPIAVAMTAPSLVGIFSVIGWAATRGVLETMAYEEAASWSLSVIPMFVLMGLLLWRSGITTDIYAAMRVLTKHVPGGLAVGTNLAGGGLAAVSGSTVATSYALARVGVPEMLKHGYDPRMATSSVLMAGTGGQLMPPSVLLVVYAGIAGIGVGPALMAGVGPGILLVASYTAAIILLAALRPALVGGRRASDIEEMPFAEKVRIVARAWPVPFLIIVVLGGIYQGVLTATEAGAAGALVALLLTLWKKRSHQPIRTVGLALREDVQATATIMFMLIGAMVLTQLLRFSGLAESLASFVVELDPNRVQFLLLIMLAYLVLGMFMSTLAVIMLTVPILAPMLASLDISLVWFGAFAVLLAETGMITPPVGVLTYIVHGVVRDPEVNLGHDISLGVMFRGVLWMLPATVIVLLLLIMFPEVVTWLPDQAF